MGAGYLFFRAEDKDEVDSASFILEELKSDDRRRKPHTSIEITPRPCQGDCYNNGYQTPYIIKTRNKRQFVDLFPCQ